ncbi:hypothetical protein Tco_1284845 [Tanacetum coccineum]
MTMVNKTSADMTELVELVSRIVCNIDTLPPPFNAAFRGKSAQPEPLKDKKVKSPFVDSDEEDQPITPANVADVPTQREPQTSGSLADENPLAVYTPTPPINKTGKGKGKAKSSDETPSEAPMTLEEVAHQLQEIKRLPNLKAAKDKSEKALQRITHD